MERNEDQDEGVSFLTTLDAARQARVSTETIRVWTRIGWLPAIRTLSGQRLFTPAAVRQAIQERERRRLAPKRHVG